MTGSSLPCLDVVKQTLRAELGRMRVPLHAALRCQLRRRRDSLL